MSSGKAARLLNIGRVEFLNLLRARGIAYVNFTPDELAEELEATASLTETRDVNERSIPAQGQVSAPQVI
jgi:hypothetical protein